MPTLPPRTELPGARTLRPAQPSPSVAIRAPIKVTRHRAFAALMQAIRHRAMRHAPPAPGTRRPVTRCGDAQTLNDVSHLVGNKRLMLGRQISQSMFEINHNYADTHKKTVILLDRTYCGVIFH